MTEATRPDPFEEIQNEFLVAIDDDPTRLGEWLREFPQYARQLTDLALHHARMEMAPDPELDSAEEEAFIASGMEIVEGILQKRGASATAETALMEDLLAEANARGLTPHGLARVLRLTVPLVTRLHRRLIRYGSIPAQLVHDLAGALKRDVASVITYLQQPPALAAGANYRSEAAPAVGEAQEFAEELAKDDNLSDADRAYWMEHVTGRDPE